VDDVVEKFGTYSGRAHRTKGRLEI
jgi:hypothetical protein